MATLDLDKVVELLHARGIAAHVEQTGGGVATIFAGEKFWDDAGDDRYKACAGPGWFEGSRNPWTLPRADTEEFYVGPDDDGETEPVTASPAWSEEDAADAIAAQAKGDAR